MTRLKDQIRLAKKALKEAKKRPGLYSEGRTGDMDPVSLNLLSGGEAKIPIGFRIPTQGITIASLLDQVTFITKHGQAEE